MKKKEETALALTDDTDKLGEIFVKSGLFADVGSKEKAIVKIMAGREIGIAPIEAMTGIHIIKGKVALGANLMAAGVKKNGKYDYKVTKHTDKECEIDFYEGDEKIGTSSFTIEDAKRAGVYISGGSWVKWPRNMLFARALSNGVKWYCPDVFGHAPVYVPEEMGVEVNEDGEPIDVTPPEDDKAIDADYTTLPYTTLPPPECRKCKIPSEKIQVGHPRAGEFHCPKCSPVCDQCHIGLMTFRFQCHAGKGIICDNEKCGREIIAQRPDGYGLYDEGIEECKKCPVAEICSEDFKTFPYNDTYLIDISQTTPKYPYTVQHERLAELVEERASEDDGDKKLLEDIRTHAKWKKSLNKGDAERISKEILLNFFDAK